MSSSLREWVIKGWLRGKNRDDIARENCVSAGTTSNIVAEWKERMSSLEADEIREFSIALRKAGVTPLECGIGLRTVNTLRNLGFTEEDVETFTLDIYKMCRNIGLQPDKIVVHIKELIGLAEKVPLSRVSDHIKENGERIEESDQQLKKVNEQLRDTRVMLDDAFKNYISTTSEARWIFLLKKQLADRGLKVDNIPDLVNTVEDIQTLGFDAKKILSKISKIDDLETRKNSLEINLVRLQKENEQQSKLLQMLKYSSSTHIQTIAKYNQLASMGLGLPELTNLVNVITESAREYGVSESIVVDKFIDDIVQHYSLATGLGSRIEELKREKEDIEIGLTMLRQSGSELDSESDAIRELWAMGLKSEDIVNLSRSLSRNMVDNTDKDDTDINSETRPTDLKIYQKPDIDIEDLNKNKEELINEITCLMSIRDWLATSIFMPLTCRVSEYFNLITGVINFIRIQVQVRVLYSFIIYHELDVNYNKKQKLNEIKLSMQSDNYQKFLPLISSACGDEVEFSKLNGALVEAIKIGSDRLRFSFCQKGENINLATTTIAALNQAKIMLEQFQNGS